MITIYRVDGGMIVAFRDVKCDFIIYTEMDALYFEELKGGNYLGVLD